MELAEDIKQKVLLKIEKLNLELIEMEVDHKSAWEMYGSELCGLDMLDKEEELRKKLKLLVDYFNGKVDIIECEKRFASEIKTVDENITELTKRKLELKSCLESVIEAKKGIFD